MLQSEIKPGAHYAFREKRKPGIPFERLKILEHIRGNKWKAEWIEPNAGLIDYVESGQLIAPWKDHKAVLREEADRQRIDEYNQNQGYRLKSPITNVLSEVFESVGENVTFWGGCLRGKPEAIDRLKTRISLKPGKHSPYSYVDRQGMLFLPFDEALEIARKFCAVEPQAVRKNRSGRARLGPDGPYSGRGIHHSTPKRISGCVGDYSPMDRTRSCDCCARETYPKT